MQRNLKLEDYIKGLKSRELMVLANDRSSSNWLDVIRQTARRLKIDIKIFRYKDDCMIIRLN